MAGLKAHIEAIIPLDVASFIWHLNILLCYVAVLIPFGLTMEVILWIQGKNYEILENQVQEDKTFHDKEKAMLQVSHQMLPLCRDLE